MIHLLKFLTVFIVVPLGGLIFFLQLRKKMLIGKVGNSLILEYFIMFVNYGGLLLIILNSFMLPWSGLSSLGLIYLLLVAPVIMGVIAYRNAKQKGQSYYHLRAYREALAYFIIAPLIIGLYFLMSFFEQVGI